MELFAGRLSFAKTENLWNARRTRKYYKYVKFILQNKVTML